MEAASLSTPGRSPFSISPPTPDSFPRPVPGPFPVRPDGTAARPRPRRTPGSTGRITGGRPNPFGGSQGRGRRVQSSRVPRFLADVLVDVRVMSCRGAHLSRRLPRIPPGPRAAPRRGRRAVTCSPAAPRIPAPGLAGEAGSYGGLPTPRRTPRRMRARPSCVFPLAVLAIPMPPGTLLSRGRKKPAAGGTAAESGNGRGPPGGPPAGSGGGIPGDHG